MVDILAGPIDNEGGGELVLALNVFKRLVHISDIQVCMYRASLEPLKDLHLRLYNPRGFDQFIITPRIGELAFS